MPLTSALIKEIEQEAASTKKMLARVPEDKFDWRPHEKSMTLKQLSRHVAFLSEWAGFITQTSELDFANNNLKRPEVNNTADLLKVHEQGVRSSIDALQATKDEDLEATWTLRNGAHVISEATKAVTIRRMALSHTYHHRAQLGVYLRLLDVPVPGMYGPSADDLAQSNP